MKQTLIIISMFLINFVCKAQYDYPQRQYNQYQETVDFQLLQRTLQTLEDRYEANIEKVYDKTSNINKLINQLSVKQNNKFTEKQTKYINSYDKYIESITKTQLSNNSETYSILKTLDGVEEQLYKILYP